jgi:hypothetical protein
LYKSRSCIFRESKETEISKIFIENFVSIMPNNVNFRIQNAYQNGIENTKNQQGIQLLANGGKQRQW